MQPGILITNGGPHPPDAWAQQTAAHLVGILDINPTSSDPEVIKARKEKARLEFEFGEALIEPHAKVMQFERDKLKTSGVKRLLEPCEPEEDQVKDVIGTINEIAAKSAFADHYQSERVQAFIRDTVQDHFRSVIDIDRSWHADANANDPEVKAYRQARDNHGARFAHVFAEQYKKKA